MSTRLTNYFFVIFGPQKTIDTDEFGQGVGRSKPFTITELG